MIIYSCKKLIKKQKIKKERTYTIDTGVDKYVDNTNNVSAFVDSI